MAAQVDTRRASRAGLLPLDSALGLALFDTARAGAPAAPLAARLDLPGLRARAAELPPVLRSLVPAPARTAPEPAEPLADTLAALPVAERERRALDVVLRHTAEVLGHATADGVDQERGFQQLGFDSLMSVELRNRLGAAAGPAAARHGDLRSPDARRARRPPGGRTGPRPAHRGVPAHQYPRGTGDRGGPSSPPTRSCARACAAGCAHCCAPSTNRPRTSRSPTPARRASPTCSTSPTGSWGTSDDRHRPHERPHHRTRSHRVVPGTDRRPQGRGDAQAPDHRSAPGQAAAARDGGPGARADRDRRHGLPVPRWRRLAGRPVATRARRPGRHGPLPHRPRLGPGRPLRRRPRALRHQPHPRGRIPARRRRVRSRPVRHQPPRGARHGPAAAPPPGDRLGGDRTRRHRPHLAARQPHRRLRRRDVPRLRHRGRPAARGRRGLPGPGHRGQRRQRPDRLHPGPGGPRRHPRHRLLLLARRPALRDPRTARGGVHDGPGGRRDRAVHPGRVRGLLPAGRPGHRRALQVLLRRSRRHRLVRGRRHAPRRTAQRRRTPRPPRPGRAARLRGQPGRRQQRPHHPPTGRPSSGSSGRRWPTPGSPPPTWTSWRATAPAPRSATRSRCRPCSPPTARTAPHRSGSAR